ncbi:glutathione S-transferase [Jackrogersella minutella]|nr:glutathione S-transferase [Jackrogersella minutella]
MTITSFRICYDLKTLLAYTSTTHVCIVNIMSLPNNMKAIRVWLTPPGPNPWMVVLILEELGVPYEIKSISFENIKKPPLINLNPNGRVPVIENPNTDLTLWESGDIIQYIIELYGVNKTLTCDTLKERHLLNQWLIFNFLRPERLPSAIERYNNQVKRVLGVLDGWLGDKEWLVGDEITYADLSFLPYNDRIDSILLCKPVDKFTGFPNRCTEIRNSLMQEQGLENATGRPGRFKTHQECEESIARGEDVSA